MYSYICDDKMKLVEGAQCVVGVKESRCAYRDLVEKRQIRTPLRRSRLYGILILKGGLNN